MAKPSAEIDFKGSDLVEAPNFPTSNNKFVGTGTFRSSKRDVIL